jgi:putative photosynthetic complex assembly protein
MTALFAQNPLGRLAPIAALVAAGAVIGVTAMMRNHTPSVPPAPVSETRMLRFTDAPHGVVRVETLDGRVVASYGSGEGSFVRGVLRSFARDRRGADVSPDVPFELTKHTDGRTSLRDTASGQVVVLDAFGSTNASLFASLLSNAKDKP